MWWENLFAAFWVLMQGLLWLGALALVGLVVTAVIAGVWKNLTRGKEPVRATLIGAAEAAAVSRYRLKPDASHVTAFVEGADYMWEHLHPKK